MHSHTTTEQKQNSRTLTHTHTHNAYITLGRVLMLVRYIELEYRNYYEMYIDIMYLVGRWSPISYILFNLSHFLSHHSLLELVVIFHSYFLLSIENSTGC